MLQNGVDRERRCQVVKFNVRNLSADIGTRGTGRLEEVGGRLSGSSKEFILLVILTSARGILIDAFCPAIPISVQPPNIRVQPFCVLVTVPDVPKYDKGSLRRLHDYLGYNSNK